MENIQNISSELACWVKSGLFNEVHYYLKSFSNVRLLFSVMDLKKSTGLDFDDNHIKLGMINKDGYVDNKSHLIPINLPRSETKVSQQGYITLLKKIIKDGTTYGLTDLYLEQKNNTVALTANFLAVCQQSIVVILTMNKIFEDFYAAMKKQIFHSHAANEISFDYLFNFILEFEDSNNRYYFLSFDYDEFDVFIDFNPDDELDVLPVARELASSKDKIISQPGIKHFNNELYNVIKYYDNMFLIQAQASADLILKYHCIIEDIFRDISKLIEQYIDKIRVLSFENLKIISMVKNNLGDKRYYPIYRVVNLIKLLLENDLFAKLIDKSKITDLDKNLRFLKSNKKSSDYRNTFAHSAIAQLDREKIIYVIRVYRKIIIFLVDFRDAIR